MSYVFDSQDALRYQRWMQDEGNRLILQLEYRLLTQMLRPGVGQRLLDIGCGTGASLMPFLDKGIELTGIDPSPHMLEAAALNLGHRVDLHRGFAEDLPFDDNAFHYSVVFLTLEFCEDPLRAIEEACRVAKDRVFIGIFNRFSLFVAHQRMRRLFADSIYKHARFFSIGEIRRMIFNRLGKIPLEWRTVLHVPWLPPGMIYRMESSEIFQSSPFGGFAGIAAEPVPRFRAIPLALKPAVNHKVRSGEQVASCAGDYQHEKMEN